MLSWLVILSTMTLWLARGVLHKFEYQSIMFFISFVVSPCVNNPCENNGTCSVDINGNATCTCDGNWNGTYCQGSDL